MPGTQSIVGITSGMDTASIVDSLIEIERQEVVLLEERQVETTNIISTYQALEAQFLSLNAALARLEQTSSFDAATVNVSDDSYLTATRTGTVGSGSYDLRVLSLARNHQIASQGFESQSEALFGSGTISLSVGEGATKTITVDANNNSLIGIKNAINDSGAGVRATIVNDGSSSNAYRLILSANETGRSHEIHIQSDLTGGPDLNYTAGSFDDVEAITMDPASSAAISLGAGAAFSANENKIYTFTVAGSGQQTVGADTITLNWSDGTNSGTIEVSQADEEVFLEGDGADGLSLNLGSGILSGGDEFQVTAFGTTLQEAADAQISLGSSGGVGSPITVTSDTNVFADVIGGLDVTAVKVTDAGESITVNTAIDSSSIKNNIDSFISAYNSVVGFIDTQNTFNSDTGASGILFGDVTLWSMQSALRNSVTSTVEGLSGKYNQLYSIGIRTGSDGTLSITNSSRLTEAIEDNLESVKKLFTNSGASTNGYIEFVAAGTDTKMGETYEVNITQAASQGRFAGTNTSDPALTPLILTESNNTIKIKVDGVVSEELTLTPGTYNSSAQLVSEIQSQIDADSKIGSRGVAVEWVDTGAGSGYLQFESSTYGSGSKVEMMTSISDSAYSTLGLVQGMSVVGKDVAGTINGEKAEGSGQLLTGADDNPNTAGLVLKVTLDSSQVNNIGADGSITLSQGIASRVGNYIDGLTDTVDGTFARRINAYETQIKELVERIEDMDELLELKRETLNEQFYQMELALSELNSQSDFLSSQIELLNNNWNFGRGN